MEISMKNLSKLFLVSLVLIMVVAFAFSSCAKVPTEEVTTGTETYTLINNNTSSSTETKTDNNVEFVFQSYYKYKGNYASVSDVRFETEDTTENAKGYVDVKMVYIEEKNDDMAIGYKAYDANGEVLRNSYLLVDLDGVRNGKTIENIRFDIPYETVKVEFFDYSES